MGNGDDLEKWLHGYLDLREVIPLHEAVNLDETPMMLVALSVWPDEFTIYTARAALSGGIGPIEAVDNAGNRYVMAASFGGGTGSGSRTLEGFTFRPALAADAQSLTLFGDGSAVTVSISGR